ncbi:uncharacterized protein BJX67DRAFT_341958 [Aspergillus lucknowensis]|uniref:Uncharacterized protein n=1 Tax=Aspergillus lucknowensis TaxID=176173 RepID=A0ABR4M402_9EURO
MELALALLSTVSTICSSIVIYLGYGVYYVVYCAAYCGYFLLSLVASPFINLGHLTIWFALLPLKILTNLGALIVYLGIASVIGATIGVSLYFIVTLAIDWVIAHHLWRIPTAARVEFKPEDLEGAKETPSGVSSDSGSNNDSWSDWGWGQGTGGLKKEGLLSETILEEESQESEFDG